MKVFYCWRSVLGRALSRQRQVLRPYALRAIFFWACDRVKVIFMTSFSFFFLIYDVIVSKLRYNQSGLFPSKERILSNYDVIEFHFFY